MTVAGTISVDRHPKAASYACPPSRPGYLSVRSGANAGWGWFEPLPIGRPFDDELERGRDQTVDGRSREQHQRVADADRIRAAQVDWNTALRELNDVQHAREAREHPDKDPLSDVARGL